MKYIKIEAIIPIEGINDKDEIDLFTETMNDRHNVTIHVNRNDILCELGYSHDFKWEFINQNK